jgi:hypothetical protein
MEATDLRDRDDGAVAGRRDGTGNLGKVDYAIFRDCGLILP